MATPSDAAFRRRTQLALAVTQRDLHSYVIEAMALTLSGSVPGAAVRSACAYRMQFLLKRVKVMAVLCDVIHGDSWDVVGARFDLDADTAESVYGPMLDRWSAGHLDPWAPSVDGATVHGLMPVDLPPDAADALEAYHCSHHPPNSLVRQSAGN